MLKQSLKLKLSQKLSPQQIQLMKLIQLPVLDFEQKLKQEIEENPALEITELANKDEFNDDENIDVDDYINDDEIPDYKLNSYNSSNKEENSIPYASAYAIFDIDGQRMEFRRSCYIVFSLASTKKSN